MKRLALVVLVPVILLANLWAWIRYVWCVAVNPKEGWRLAIGFDQLFNAAANGNEDETVSSRAARARTEGRRWGCVLCRFLDQVDPGHCDRSAGV